MRRSGWKTVVVVVVVIAAVWWIARRRAPEDRLAARFGELCEIAGDNVETPARGVERVGALFAAHAADMLHDVGELVVETTRGGEREALARARAAGADAAAIVW